MLSFWSLFLDAGWDPVRPVLVAETLGRHAPVNLVPRVTGEAGLTHVIPAPHTHLAIGQWGRLGAVGSNPCVVKLNTYCYILYSW